MNQVKCPKCGSMNVTIVNSDEVRQRVGIHCFGCGEESEINDQDFHVDTDDLRDVE